VYQLEAVGIGAIGAVDWLIDLSTIDHTLDLKISLDKLSLKGELLYNLTHRELAYGTLEKSLTHLRNYGRHSRNHASCGDKLINI